MRNSAQESRKWSSGSKDIGSRSFQGQNDLFRRFWDNSRIFGEVGGSLAEKTGLLQNLGDKIWEFFWGLLWIFRVFGVV
jgi:hypothetical protein